MISLNNKGVVKITAHPQTGLVITRNVNNPKYGTIRVDSEVLTFSKDGFANLNKRTAFIRGEYDILNSLRLKDGMTLPGKIIKKESYEPFYEGQAPKINPQTGEEILTNGRNTYLQFIYTEDMNAMDMGVDEVEIEPTNVEVSEEVGDELY